MLSLLAMCIMITFALPSCKDEDRFLNPFNEPSDFFPKEEVNEVVISPEEENQKILEYLDAEHGIDISKIQFSGQFIIYDGDMLFERVTLLETMKTWKPSKNSDQLQQHRRNAFVPSVGQRRIQIVVNNAIVPLEWRTALVEAITEWNALKGAIVFTTNATNVSTTVYYRSAQNTNCIAEAELPVSLGSGNVRPGSFITINSSNNWQNNTSPAMRKHTMMHELGHIMGFHHTDGTDGSPMNTLPTPCNQVGGDPYSIMKPNMNITAQFTNCDKTAYYTLF